MIIMPAKGMYTVHDNNARKGDVCKKAGGCLDNVGNDEQKENGSSMLHSCNKISH